MLVTIRIPDGATATDDCQVRVTWAVPASRSLGSADVTIRRASPLWTVAGSRPHGGFLVEIADASLGVWRGVADAPRFEAGHGSIHAVELMAALGTRVVARSRTVRALTAGAIARLAFVDAIGGLGSLPLTIGTFAEVAPVVEEYSFSGQTLMQVLGDLADTTTGQQEWEIAEPGIVNWRPLRGTWSGVTLCADGDLVNVQRQDDQAEPAVEVIAVGSDDTSYTARAQDGNVDWLWPRQVVTSVQTTSMVRLAREAEAQLAVLRTPAVSYTAGLREGRWASVREGDYVRLVLPYSTATGETVIARVMSREYQSGSATVTLSLALVAPFTAQTPLRIGAGAAGGTVNVGKTGDPLRRLVALEAALVGGRQTA
jgi:hypothetical protein